MAPQTRNTVRALPPLAQKMVPGGARPTPAPQNAGAPYYGMISPLVQELDTGGPGGYANMYGGFLPRPSSVFTQGAFGPFSPILPVPVDAPPAPDATRAEPRLWQYDPGWNLPVGQPGTEGIKLCDFGTLKTLADLYSVARACIQLRKAEILGLNWDIMPTKDASKAMRGNKAAMKDFGERKSEAVAFFRHPDPDYFSWHSFLDVLLEEIFVFDALSLLLRPKWRKGGNGLLGSDLDSLSLISGPTIRPLVGLHGQRPRPPAPAYQQYLFGVPRTDLTTMWTERDLEESGLNMAQRKQFRGDQLLYLPMVPRRWTPYGFPPIERALIPVMAGLQKQGYQLDFFREGTIPGTFISPGMNGQAPMTANQIRELQDALNAIAGDPAWKHKIIVLPPDSKIMPQKPTELADQFDEIVMNQVCMAFDVQPMELGISPKVSTTQSPGASNQMAKASQSSQERKATKPLLTFLSDIFNTILRDICEQPDMQFVFEGLEEDEDEETLTNLLVTQVGAGLASVDEAREALGKQPWGLPETSDPGWATPTGFVPLGQMLATGVAAPGAQPNANAPAVAQPPGGAAGGPQKPGQPPAQGGKPTPGKPSAAGNQGQSPGHDAAEAAADKPSSGTSSTPAAKTPAKSKSAAAAIVKAQEKQRKRDARTNGIVQNVAQNLQQVAMQYHDGNITAPAAIDAGTQVMADGYQNAMDLASQDAAAEYQVVVQDFSGAAMLMAQEQRSYLGSLLISIASSYNLNWLNSRLQTYANTMNRAYNQAEGQTVQASKPNYEIIWHLGESEHCGLCINRDGKSFTFESLPGYPGDGGFGGPLCEGGPNCNCSLEYKEPGNASLIGSNTQRQWATGYYAQQLEDISGARADALAAREEFVSSLPGTEDSGAQMRALTTDQIRQDIASLANQYIRESGGYPGVSVNPSDIPADLITELAPAWAKSAKAVESELDALLRHVRKGRDIGSWETRNIPESVLLHMALLTAKGVPSAAAVFIVKELTRRINLDGQEVWVTQTPGDQAAVDRVAGGGGRVFPAPDVNGIETPGGTQSTEPPRWTPPAGTGTGSTFSDPKPRPSVKGESDPGDPNPVPAEHVYNQMLENFPAKALGWVLKARWIGPVEVAPTRVDTDDEESWAASHEPDRVKHFVKQLKKGKTLKPGICVQEPGEYKVKCIDGHHRFLASRQADEPYMAYVGFVNADGGPWDETHSFQIHQGADPGNE